MDLGVAVDLGGRGEDEAGAVLLRQAEHVVGAVGADLERVQRQAQVVDRARRRGHVVDEVDLLLDEQRLGDVVLEEPELGRLDVLDVLQRAGVEVVDADHPVALVEQVVAEVGAEESGSAGDDASSASRGDDSGAPRAQGAARGAVGLIVSWGQIRSPSARRRAAIALLEAHRAALWRAARRVSLCADDADDAFQRAALILLTKAPPVELRTLNAWMRVVTRREALAVRRARERLLGSGAEPDRFEAAAPGSPRARRPPRERRGPQRAPRRPEARRANRDRPPGRRLLLRGDLRDAGLDATRRSTAASPREGRALRTTGSTVESKGKSNTSTILTMRVTSKGQVTIPKEIRDEAGLLPGTDVEFTLERGVVRVRRAKGSPSRGDRLVERLRRPGARTSR